MKRTISFLFFCVALATAIEPDLDSDADVPLGGIATSSELEAMKIRFSNGADATEYEEVLVGESIKFLQELSRKNSTVVYVHGWLGDVNKKVINTVLDAYLGLRSYNVLQLNWHDIANKRYIQAVGSLRGVGETVAKALNVLVASGMDASGLHIIGHSLGAHVSGFIGKNVNFTMPRITGLDPAGPLFITASAEDRLSFTDAQFVDVVHTDSGFLGLGKRLGHVDFYPNGGDFLQPGCQPVPNACSHNMVNFFWAESVINNEAFIGRECSSYSQFQNGSCNSNPTEVMGHHTRNTARGEIYLQTNGESPYGRGKAGSKPKL